MPTPRAPRDDGPAHFWNQEAAKLLAPLLHAAALGPGTVAAVIGWLDSQQADEPAAILKAAGAGAALAQLQGVANLDPRKRGTTYMSATDGPLSPPSGCC